MNRTDWKDFASERSGGVGISTDKIRNVDFLHIATLSQDFTNPTEELMDGGGICFQTIDNLASTGRIFSWNFLVLKYQSGKSKSRYSRCDC